MANFKQDEAKFFFLLKKKIKMADSKKGHFSKSPILNIFLWKFYGLVLGLVELNDAKGIDVIYQNSGKNAFFEFFGHFWAYLGQPHDHIPI